LSQFAYSRAVPPSRDPVRLIGIARMAAESSVVVEKRRVEY